MYFEKIIDILIIDKRSAVLTHLGLKRSSEFDSLAVLGVEKWVLMSLVVEDITNVEAQLLLEHLTVFLRNDHIKVKIIEVLELDDHGSAIVGETLIFVVVTFDVGTLEVRVVVQVIVVLLMVSDVFLVVAGGLLGCVDSGNLSGVSVWSHLIVKIFLNLL